MPLVQNLAKPALARILIGQRRLPSLMITRCRGFPIHRDRTPSSSCKLPVPRCIRYLRSSAISRVSLNLLSQCGYRSLAFHIATTAELSATLNSTLAAEGFVSDSVLQTKLFTSRAGLWCLYVAYTVFCHPS